MSYIAKIALPYRGRFIPPGAKVPEDSKRLAEGIKRGWIKVVGDPAATTLPVRTVAKAPVVVETVTVEPIVVETVIAETEILAPEITKVDDSPLIEDLDGLNPMAKKSLTKAGIINVAQLEGYSAEALDDLPGIGVALAQRLLAEFNKHCEAVRTAEYSNMPGEDHGSYETSEASGEDEGPEDDQA